MPKYLHERQSPERSGGLRALWIIGAVVLGLLFLFETTPGRKLLLGVYGFLQENHPNSRGDTDSERDPAPSTRNYADENLQRQIDQMREEREREYRDQQHKDAVRAREYEEEERKLREERARLIEEEERQRLSGRGREWQYGD